MGFALHWCNPWKQILTLQAWVRAQTAIGQARYHLEKIGAKTRTAQIKRLPAFQQPALHTEEHNPHHCERQCQERHSCLLRCLAQSHVIGNVGQAQEDVTLNAEGIFPKLVQPCAVDARFHVAFDANGIARQAHAGPTQIQKAGWCAHLGQGTLALRNSNHQYYKIPTLICPPLVTSNQIACAIASITHSFNISNGAATDCVQTGFIQEEGMH